MEVRKTPILVLGLLLGLAAGSSAWANPDGPTVVHGQVSMTRPNLNTLNITNSPGAIINWRGFSIGANETTRFIQQSASSSVLNRVIGENPSQILGQLLSNGRVFLVNPNGVVFGPNSVVDVAGLIASTLQMSDADFMAGRHHFEGDGEGSIDNRGYIRAGPGGEVVLIAPSIENSGIIEADGGQLILAAGRSVTLTSLDYEGVQFEVQAPEDEVLNLGALLAEQGAAGVFAGTINNAGRIEANSLTIDETGAIVLSAQADIHLEEGSVLSASGPTGGDIHVESETGTTWVAGQVEATGSQGTGGDIRLLGRRVGVIADATIDASAESGGGEILIGGDYRGENPAVKNAEATFVGAGSTIKADALTDGDGGRIIVWSNEATRAYGEISATGGAESGDGGFVETSGHYLDVVTVPAVGAPKGEGGTWLLDPFDVDVATPDQNISAGPTFTPTATGSQVAPASITAVLGAGNNVIVDTVNGGGAEPGDITVIEDIVVALNSGNASLTFNAANNVIVSGDIDASGGANNLAVILNPDNEAPAGGIATITGTIDTNNGTVDLAASTEARLSGSGIIRDSTITASGGGAWSVPASATGTLDGVTLATDVSVLNQGNLFIEGGLLLNGGSRVRLMSTPNQTSLFVTGSQTLGGTGGSVTFEGTGDNARIVQSGSTTLTIGPNVTVGGSGSNRGGTFGVFSNIINQGLIEAATSGRTIDTSVSGTLTNTGTLRAIGSGTLLVDELNNQGGLGQVNAGSTLTLEGTTADWTNTSGSIDLLGGTLNLGGSFDALGAFNRDTGIGTVNLQGVFTPVWGGVRVRRQHRGIQF